MKNLFINMSASVLAGILAFLSGYGIGLLNNYFALNYGQMPDCLKHPAPRTKCYDPSSGAVLLLFTFPVFFTIWFLILKRKVLRNLK